MEREISLFDLLMEMLSRWRMFIIWMLCGAVLLGTFSYARSLRSANAQAAQVEEAKHQLEEQDLEGKQEELPVQNTELLQELAGQLSDAQRRNVEMIAAYEKWLTSCEDSALLQIDANNVQQAEIIFHISSESKDQSYSIETVYENIVSDGELAQYVSEVLDMPSNISTLFTLQSEKTSNITNDITSDITNNIMNDITIRTQGIDNFGVRVIHYDEQTCRDMAQAVIDFVENKHNSLVQKLGKHEIAVVNSSFAVVYDSELSGAKQRLINSIIAVQDTVVKRKADLSDKEWKYYDILVNGEITGLDSTGILPLSPEAIIARGITVTPQISVKYVLIGMVLAAFVYAFYIFVIYVVNPKIRITDNLQQLYTVPQLGLISAHDDKKKIFGFVDKWIESLRNWSKRQFAYEEAFRLASVAVKMAAQRNELTSVYLLGCDLKGQTMSVCEKIRDDLGKDNIETVILNNILYDAVALKGLESARGVVLVETAGSTLYTEIEQELELLKRENIEILGGILVE